MKERPFLDDPAAYPEFSMLIKRQGLQHALRQALHQHRTCVLLFMVALSIAASGAEVSGNSSAEWVAYLAKGINLELLEKHFEGIVSALGCMAAVTVTSLLAYPIYQWAHPVAVKNGAVSLSWCRSRAVAMVLATAAPATAAWAIAVYGAGLFRWGVASGLCVGLQCASLTLKSVSFVQQASPATATPSATAVAVSAAGGGLGVARPAARASGGDGGDLGAVTANASVPDEGHSSIAEGTGDGYTRVPNSTLNFGEFAFFLLVAPSLVCEPRFLASSARRPRHLAAAASEFLHAGLTYLTVHVTCSAFFAPTLRVLAEALHSGGGSGWADDEDWAELHRADGSGWWLHGRGGGCEEGGAHGVGCALEASFFEGIGRQALAVAVAACLGMFVLSPMMHFLMFYAFFHSVCLGTAELHGYPDRNIYGPWWLVISDPRDYFRLWSAPVHRWLSTSIQRPMIAAGHRAALRRRVSREEGRSSQVNGNGSCVQGPPEQRGISSTSGSSTRSGCEGIVARWWLASVVCSFLVSGIVHEAVAFVAMRRTFWPFNTLFLAVSASMTPFWDALFPVVVSVDVPDSLPAGTPSSAAVRASAAAAAGGGGDEASVEKAAMRPGEVVTSTAATKTITEEGANKRGHAGDGQLSNGAGKLVAEAFGQEGSKLPRVGRERASRSKIGSWRGWTAVVFYAVASAPLTLVVDYLVWQWWRHTHLVE